MATWVDMLAALCTQHPRSYLGPIALPVGPRLLAAGGWLLLALVALIVLAATP